VQFLLNDKVMLRTDERYYITHMEIKHKELTMHTEVSNRRNFNKTIFMVLIQPKVVTIGFS
jgi:hypothetical protein